jgi:hypothetical protein
MGDKGYSAALPQTLSLGAQTNKPLSQLPVSFVFHSRVLLVKERNKRFVKMQCNWILESRIMHNIFNIERVCPTNTSTG